MTRAGEAWPTAGMANVLSEEKNQQVVALGKLGWPLRRIEEETGVRRETASGYLKAAGVPVRPPRGWGGRLSPSKPAKETSTDPGQSSNLEAIARNRWFSAAAGAIPPPLHAGRMCFGRAFERDHTPRSR